MTRLLTRRAITRVWPLSAGALALPAIGRAEAKSVKIAMIAPLSGPWARQGQLLRMGAEILADDVNAAGGIKALGGAKLEIIYADAGDSTEKAKNAAQRLMSDEPELAGGTGSWLSSFTLAVTEVTERAQLPWVTLSYSDAITNRGFKFVFQTSPTAEHQAAETLPTALKLAATATGKRPTTVGIIQDNTASPVSFAKPLREGGLDKLGLKLVVDQIFTPPLSDATPLIEKVRSGKARFPAAADLRHARLQAGARESSTSSSSRTARCRWSATARRSARPSCSRRSAPNCSKGCCSALPIGR
jgi:branched-chain amino acid transport system substrate-binding protein